ncbi:MAG: hypothetical protein ITG01_13445, partial [Comamonas sp.]|nr:hypothetical protein [Comamonas sp.]
LHHDLFLWLLPVTGGLILSAPLSWVSGKLMPGNFLAFFGILRTPEDRRPPAIISAVLDDWQDIKQRILQTADASPLALLLTDSSFNAWHCAQISPVPAGTLTAAGTVQTEEEAFDPALILARAKAWRTSNPGTLEGWMSKSETMAFLHNRDLIVEVARRVSS